MQFLKRILAFLALLGLGAPIPAASGEETGLGFDAYLQLLAARARAEGVSEPTIQSMTAGLTPNPRVVALDRNQPGQATNTGFPAMAPYIARHVGAGIARNGRDLRASLGPLGSDIEARYGVPLPVMIAIFGHETNYGSYTGDFDLARSLATLAWEGRRREMFADEFVALLKIADQGVPRSRLAGSWAGAFGYPQFMPSVYLRLAADGDGDGDRDIWASRADALASIANYFRDAGWRRGQPWGVAAFVPAGFDRAAIQGELAPPVCPRVHVRFSQWKTVREWRALGVQPQGWLADDVLASLFEPDGPGTNAYLLTGNYRVILEYNCSNYYALSVGLLADEIGK